MNTNTCTIPGCARPIHLKSRGICEGCYQRWRHHGSYAWLRKTPGSGYNRSDGYIEIRADGKRHLLHRYLMEQHLGRKLQRLEYVHHKDHDKSNNNLSNLEVVPAAIHTPYHLTKHKNGLKTCKTCHQVLPIAQFYKCGGYYIAHCRLCMRAYAKAKRLQR